MTSSKQHTTTTGTDNVVVGDVISIHDLMRAVKAHPDYVFGTVFVKDDFPGGEVDWEETGDAKWAEEHIVAAGFEYIEFNTVKA